MSNTEIVLLMTTVFFAGVCIYLLLQFNRVSEKLLRVRIKVNQFNRWMSPEYQGLEKFCIWMIDDNQQIARVDWLREEYRKKYTNDEHKATEGAEQ